MSDSSPRLFRLILVLVLIGLAGSVYLTQLDLRIMRSGGEAVDSFCSFGARFDCVEVASSKYSLVLGIPIALYGIEFFVVALGLLLLGRRSETWPSYLFWMTAASLPVIAVLGYLSLVVIDSVCVVCLLVHTCNLTAFVTLLIAHRGRLGELLAAGPREIVALLRSPGPARGLLLAVAVLALSQFFWAPRFFTDLGGGGVHSWRGLRSAGMTIGRPDAPLQIEVFTDYQCPFCGRASRALLEAMARHPDEIFLRHRDFPMDQACNPLIKRPFHPQACAAARVARCAARQGKFWPLGEQLFNHRESLDEATMMSLAGEVGLDRGELRRCLADPAIAADLRADISEGLGRGVEGTPTFFVNGEKIVGFRSPEFWEEKLAEALRQR